MVINGRHLFRRSPIQNMEGGKLYDFGVSFGLGEAGYDIRIKQEITFTRDLFQRRIVDRSEYDYAEDGMVNYREKGRFILASSMEEFSMPKDLMGIVHDKSSWARKGLSVFNTVIEPGWRGFLTLELVYHGQKDLHIEPGSGIAQVIFHQVSEHAEYRGRYQNQADKPVPAISAKKMELL